MAIGEANEPVVILMPSLVISRSVSLIAAFGVFASPCRYSILRPLIPPRSLIMSRAICIASQFSRPFLASGPVKGNKTPMRMLSSALAEIGAASKRQANRTRRRPFMVNSVSHGLGGCSHKGTIGLWTVNASRSGAQDKGSALLVLPFDRAANRRLLVRWGQASGRNRAHSLDKLSGRPRPRRSCAALVEPAAIFELAIGIVTEKVRRTDRPVHPSDRLGLVVQVWKRKIMSLCEALHILKRIFRIAGRIIRANRREAYVLRHQYTGVRNHAIDHRLDIGTMVADEGDDRAFCASNVVQCV